MLERVHGSGIGGTRSNSLSDRVIFGIFRDESVGYR
jgi:hypothetical protein